MKKVVTLLTASIIALSANSAIAESGKWYLGVGAGHSNFNDWTSKSDMMNFRDGFGSRIGVVNFVGTENTNVEDKASGFKLFGGYEFDKKIAGENIAVEYSYIHMGKVDASSLASGTFYDPANNSVTGDLYASASARVDALTLDARLNIPMTSFAALMVKAGVYTADTKLKLHASSDISAETYSYSRIENSTGLHYGLGVDFRVTQAVGLRAEWERLDHVETNGGKSDIDLLSASLIYSF
jgi:OOP family OmpA-OmpF porin